MDFRLVLGDFWGRECRGVIDFIGGGEIRLGVGVLIRE